MDSEGGHVEDRYPDEGVPDRAIVVSGTRRGSWLVLKRLHRTAVFSQESIMTTIELAGIKGTTNETPHWTFKPTPDCVGPCKKDDKK